jgi:hypothetical protein
VWSVIHTVIFVGHMDWETETKEVKFLLTLVREMDLLSPTRSSRSLRGGKLQAITIDISWIYEGCTDTAWNGY